MVTALLLAAPVYTIHHFAGLGFYLRSNVESTQNEAQRTNLLWPTFESVPGVAGFFDNEVNAASWIYYVCLLLPAAAASAAILTRPRLTGLDVDGSRAVLLTLALYAAVLNHFLLRGNLAARFGDLGAPVGVLGAWLAGLAPAARLPAIAWRSVLAGLMVSLFLAVNTTGSVMQELATTALRFGPVAAGTRFVQVARELGTMPPGRAADQAERDRSRLTEPNVVAYLRACTGPYDRILVLADAAEVAAFANRAFAGGHPAFRSGFYTLPEDQRLTVERLHRQSVPIVLTRDEADYQQHIEPVFRSVVAWVDERYEYYGQIPALTGPPMRVLVRRDMAGSERLGNTGLPCPQ
jgi:hypothetical protein